MPTQNLAVGGRSVDIYATGTVTQASTATYATVTGADIDARAWRSVAYTIVVTTNAVTWQVLGANSADYSDAVVVQEGASVAAGASSTYAVAQAPYAYYRIQIQDTVSGTHGTAKIAGLAKG